MPATTIPSRPASERQLSYIRALVAERSEADLAHLSREILDANEGRPIRRDLIDRLILVPRNGTRVIPGTRVSVAPTTTSSITEGDPIPAPTRTSRAGRMLAAGSIEATATLADGRHVTVQIRTRTRSGRGWRNGFLGEQGARTNISILGVRVGWITGDAVSPYLVLRTRRPEYVAAVRAVLAYAAGHPLGSGVERVQEASRCGRCFRTLTDPVSIDRGIGPECYGRDTGSQHVAATAAERAERAKQEAAALAERRASAEERRQAQRSALTGFGLSPVRAPGATTGTIATWAETRNTPPVEAPAPIGPTVGDHAREAVGAAAVRAARNTIAEALDAYCDDRERDLAMRIFDQLAAL